MKKTDFELYFQKLGLNGKQKADLLTLKRLQNLHQQTFPFENLNPFLGLPVELDLSILFDKFLNQQRGGYCFEQNLLFGEVLKHIGYKVKWTLARVHSDEVELGRTHLLLLVEVEGDTYLCDVGFGGWVYAEPLKFKLDELQFIVSNEYKIEKQNGEYEVWVKFRDQWQKLYSFNLNTYLLADIQVVNWFTSTSPKTNFTHQLVLAFRNQENTKFTLRNTLFSIYKPGEEPLKQELKSEEEINQVLEKYFQLKPRLLANWYEKVAKIF